MNNMMPDPPHVRVPEGAVAWSPTRGFVFDQIDRDMLVEQGVVVLDVDDGAITPVHGDAPLIAVLRLEYEIVDLRWRLLDVADLIADTFTAR